MITCTSLLGAFFVRQGDTVICLDEAEAIALKRRLTAGLVISDGPHQITLTEDDVPPLAAAITAVQRQRKKRRRADRRALWH